MKFCLIGEKLIHSYSKDIHNLNGVTYDLVELKKDELESFCKNSLYDGFNVTIPYKEEVIKYLDELSLDAKSVGAVNTVVKKDGKLIGYNTDVSGFIYALKLKGVSVSGKTVMVLGTGGASKAVKYALEKEGAKNIIFVSRKGEINYQNCYEFQEVDVLINATPVGTFPDFEKSPLEIEKFENLSFVFDLIYNPNKTKLLLQAEDRKISYTNGLSMLVKQALDAETLWGVKGDFSETYLINAVKNRNLSIVLTGMPGCGKSTVGYTLAKSINKEFIDLDLEIEKNTGVCCSDIILKNGEDYFRKLETETLKSVLINKAGGVIALGGGAIISSYNRELLRYNSITVYVKRDLDKLSTNGRPLSQKNGVVSLYNERKEFYETANITVCNDGDITSCVKEIIKNYETFSN